MPFDFVLPDLGEGITEGEIRKWTVKEGDAVEEHQTVLEIETDKAIVEVPSPRKGKVLKIRKAEGETAQVGETLMTISLEGEAVEQKANRGKEGGKAEVCLCCWSSSRRRGTDRREGQGSAKGGSAEG